MFKRTLGLQTEVIPEVVVGSLPSRNLIVRLGLHSMDNIGKLDGILDEEDWDVVSNDIPVAFLSVEFNGETTHVTNCICATTRTLDCGEADKDGRLTRSICKNASHCHVFSALV